MTILKKANRAMRDRQYDVAYRLYLQAFRGNPWLRKVVAVNLEIIKRRIGDTCKLNFKNIVFEIESEMSSVVAKKDFSFEKQIKDKSAAHCEIINESCKDSARDNLSSHKFPFENISASEDWDTRCYSTITHTGQQVDIPSKLFVVPAVMSHRNTTRYRVHHLVELCENLVQIAIVNYRDKNECQAFFTEIEQKSGCVVILQRLALSDAQTTAFLDRLRLTSVRIVYDLDDQIFDGKELEEWRIAGLQHPPEAYWRAMNYAEQFLVSTKALRRHIERAFRRPVHILPNVLNNEILSRSQVAAAQNVDRPVFIIGYASGSATHDGDLACALDGISHFLSAQPQAQFHCLGDVNLPTWFAREHAAQIKLFKKVDWRELPEFLARFSVQIVPLDDVPFNHSKSQIRYLESSAVGVPVLASRCGEQALTIIDGYTGMLCFNTPKDWQHGLEWFYKHPAESRKMGSCARDYLNKYWTTQSHFRREKWRNILQDCMLGRMRDKISIIVVVYNPLYDVVALCESIQQYTKVPYELLIWVNASDPSTRAYIQGLNIHASYVVDLDVNVGKAFAANYLFRLAHERFVVGMDDDYILPQYWDEKMIASSKSVPNLGWLSTNLTSDSSGIRDLGKSVNYPGGTVLFQPSGVGGWVVFTTASVRERLGFYREHGLYGGIDGDYNRRARAMGLVTGYVRDVVGRHKVQRDKNLAWELFKQRIQDKMRIHGKQSDLVLDKFVDFSRVRSSRLTCAIKISTSVTHDENVWGDTHYAYGLKSALESLDYEVRIDKHECWYKVLERMDVVVHLFGLHEYDPDPESLNIIWIISHVDKIHRAQLLKYDYIFCASTQVAKYVAKLAPEIKCDVLHQCTDSNVFFQDSSVQRDIDVLFVGNSRRIFRDSVRFAIEAGVDLKVWGTKWEQFIPKRHIQAQSIHSRDVAQLYRRARIVLNDHWADQRDFGLVNNRVYDAFACGACVLSDDNFGFDEISLGASIPTFKDIKSFKKQIDNLLFDETMRSKLVHDIGNNVLLNHTFKHRAEKIHNVVRYLILHYVDYKSEKLYQVRKLITEGEVRLN